MGRHSLAIRVFISSLLLILLPLVAYLSILVVSNYRAQTHESLAHLNSVAHSRSFIVTDYVYNKLDLLGSMEYLLNLASNPPKTPTEPLTPTLAELAKINRLRDLYFLYKTEDGKFLCTAASKKSFLNQDFNNSLFIKEAPTKQFLASFSHFGSPNEERCFYVSRTVYDPKTKQVVGLLIGETPLQSLVDILIGTSPVDTQVDFSLIDANGVIFKTSNPLFNQRTISVTDTFKPSSSKETLFVTRSKNNPADYTWNVGGKGYIGAFIHVQDANLSLLTSSEIEPLLGVRKQLLIHLIGFTVLLSCAIILVSWWTTQRISRPIKRLVQLMQKIGGGDMQARFTTDPLGYEINEIGNGLNKMLEELIAQMETAKNEKVKNETLANELKIGHNIQLSILPRQMPSIQGLDIAARSQPAQEVGGDFYDVFVTPDPQNPEMPQLFLSIADAAGKGISACLYSLCLRSMLRSYSVQTADVGVIAREANNLFLQDAGESLMFVTAFLALYDPQIHLLKYYSCGHPPAIVKRADGRIEKLHTPGIAMGVTPYDVLSQAALQLEKGDLVCFYTDGVTDAHTPALEAFGEARLIEFLKKQSGQTSDQLLDALLAEIEKFVDGAAQFDDITILILQVN